MTEDNQNNPGYRTDNNRFSQQNPDGDTDNKEY